MALLQLRKDACYQGHMGPGWETVQANREPDLNPAVPQPGDLDIDLAVVDFLEFRGYVHSWCPWRIANGSEYSDFGLRLA